MLYISYISIKIKTKHHFRRCIFFFFSSRIFIWFFYSFHVSTEISQLLPYRVLFKSFFYIYNNCFEIFVCLFQHLFNFCVCFYLLIFYLVMDEFSCLFACLPVFKNYILHLWMLCCWVSGFCCLPLEEGRVLFWHLVNLPVNQLDFKLKVGLELSVFQSCCQPSFEV